VIDPREDNKIFLYSLCQDIWIREKCVVIRSTVFDAVRARWQWLQQCLSRFSNHPWNYERECAAIEDANFEREHKFIPIPQPNHVRELEALLAPLPEPERMSPFDGSIGDPYGGGYRTFPDGSPMPPQQGSNDVPAPRDTGECRPAGSY
jgi:hypothetical protein